MLLQVAFLILSLVFLYFGAEFALNGAEKIGKYLKLSPLVIGLLIIGFGTSLPEFFVSHLASYRGLPGMAIGNVLGSNVANVFLIMGITALFVPLHMYRADIRDQLISHIVLTIFAIIVFVHGQIGVLSTLLLGGFFVAYIIHLYHEMRKFKRLQKEIVSDIEEVDEVNFMIVGQLLLGFGLLYGGGELLVSSGSQLGEMIGISEYVISAVFVAFGTSLPELITALLACFKGKDLDMITGNIIGSNIFNVAFVMGSLGGYQISIEGTYVKELSVLMGVAVFLLLLALAKRSLNWIGGILFLGVYITMVINWINT